MIIRVGEEGCGVVGMGSDGLFYNGLRPKLDLQTILLKIHIGFVPKDNCNGLAIFLYYTQNSLFICMDNI